MPAKPSVSLYISTSNLQASVGLDVDGSFYFIESNQSNRHSDFINLAVHQILELYSVGYQDLNQIIIERGPGSFTGVRVGIACAKALSYSLNIPIYSINSLRALFMPTDDNCEYALNAFRNSVYLLNSNYDVETKTLIEFDCYLKSLARPKTLVGDALVAYHDFLSQDARKNIEKNVTRYPHVRSLYTQFTCDSSSFKKDDWKSLTPFYLRLSSAEEVYLEKKLRK
jgi:tRNA threonylcarbamoyladenosine biosynthesis protein TsaB